MYELNIITKWHDLLNRGEINQATDLVHENIKMIGPKGIAEGITSLTEWFDRAKITLDPEKYYKHNNIILVEELAKWHSETGEVIGSSKVYSVYEVVNDKISSIARYDELETAFKISGLNPSDEIEV